MHSQSFQLQVNIPDFKDFEVAYPQYGPFARNDGQLLFALIMTPDSYISARAAIINHDLPPVAGVAKACYDFVQTQPSLQWDNHLKQFIGAAVSTLVVANGFRRTEVSKSVPHPAFTKAKLHKI